MKKMIACSIILATSIVVSANENIYRLNSIFVNDIAPQSEYNPKNATTNVNTNADKATVLRQQDVVRPTAKTYRSDLKSLLGGKSYFYVKIGADYLHHIEFDADVTSVTWTVVTAGKDSKKSATKTNNKQTVKIEENKLLIGKEGKYITLKKETLDYLLFKAGSDEEPKERFYFSEPKASAYLTNSNK